MDLSTLFEGHNDKPSVNITNVPDGTRIVVVSDMQVPLHDQALLDTIFKKFVPAYKPKTGDYHLFLNGDVMDNFTLSLFLTRVLPKFSLGDEVEMTKDLLKSWSKHFTHRHYVFGNHEDRWEREMYARHPQMAKFSKSLHEALDLDGLGYDWVPYLKHYDFEGFIVTHGDTTVKHAATRMLETYHSSGTSGHVNRPQSFTYADAARGEPITWYCTGMTCRTDIGDVIKDWRKIQPWMQGFLIGEVHKGVLHVELVRVHHGGFWAAGRHYETA